jgi:hypothetical protein
VEKVENAESWQKREQSVITYIIYYRNGNRDHMRRSSLTLHVARRKNITMSVLKYNLKMLLWVL